MFPRLQRKRAPSKAAFQAVLFETGYKSSFLYSYRKIAIVHLSCFPPRLVCLLLTSPIGAFNSKERGIDLYERLERSLTGRIVTGHPVEWSIGGGQRVLR